MFETEHTWGEARENYCLAGVEIYPHCFAFFSSLHDSSTYIFLLLYDCDCIIVCFLLLVYLIIPLSRCVERHSKKSEEFLIKTPPRPLLAMALASRRAPNTREENWRDIFSLSSFHHSPRAQTLEWVEETFDSIFDVNKLIHFHELIHLVDSMEWMISCLSSGWSRHCATSRFSFFCHSNNGKKRAERKIIFPIVQKIY